MWRTGSANPSTASTSVGTVHRSTATWNFSSTGPLEVTLDLVVGNSNGTLDREHAHRANIELGIFIYAVFVLRKQITVGQLAVISMRISSMANPYDAGISTIASRTWASSRSCSYSSRRWCSSPRTCPSGAQPGNIFKGPRLPSLHGADWPTTLMTPSPSIVESRPEGRARPPAGRRACVGRGRHDAGKSSSDRRRRRRPWRDRRHAARPRE